ncbi:MAG TPA: hypothetical protein VHM25_08825 [Polyangiaceae bacterium]|nr:hypothetical protein [Polyangiaceae bacterium]
MAFRPAIRSVSRVALLGAAFFGLTAGAAPRIAAAEPTSARAAAFPDPAEPLPTTSRSVTLDEYPPPAAKRNLLIVGLTSTALWYGGALGVSYAVDDPAMAKDLRIPFAGPWMALSHTGCNGGPSCNTFLVVLGAILTSLDGVGQIAGLGLAGEGLFMPTQEPKRARAARGAGSAERAELAKRHKDFDWRPTFDAGKNTVGLGVLGVF